MRHVCSRGSARCPAAESLAEDRIHLELHQPIRLNEAGHLDKRARGPHPSEALRVGTGRLAPLPNVRQHHSSPDHVDQRSAGILQRILDDVEAADRLPVHIPGRRGATVGRDRRGTGNADVGPRTHGAGKADFPFKRRARGHQPTRSSHGRSMPESGAMRVPFEFRRDSDILLTERFARVSNVIATPSRLQDPALVGRAILDNFGCARRPDPVKK